MDEWSFILGPDWLIAGISAQNCGSAVDGFEILTLDGEKLKAEQITGINHLYIKLN